MAMSSSTLATELQVVAPESTELAAINNLADAFVAYFTAAQAGASILPGALVSGRSAFVAAASGISNSGQGANKLIAAIQAFWAGIVASPSSYFTTAIPPCVAPFGALSVSDLQDVFDDNTDDNTSLNTAVAAIATEIHSKLSGGSITISGPTVIPIT